MKVGAVIAERFELEELAGRGAAATVYRALDRSSGVRVALKIGRESDAASRLRCEREASLTRALADGAFARYVTHGEVPGGRSFLAVEWIEGETLAARLARGPLSLGESLSLAERVCRGLVALARHGIVHRDLKPSNLLLREGEAGRATLVDFGIALGDGVAEPWAEGALLGTPGYLAPEQARGERVIDGRADLYALGAVLFECLTGAPAFDGEDALTKLLRGVHDDPAPLSAVLPGAPSALEGLVARLLAKDPAKRPPDAAATLELVLALQDEAPTRIARPSVAPRRPRASISDGEVRTACIVVARPERGDATRRALDDARRDLSELGVALHELADGTVHVFHEVFGDVSAMLLARAAIALHDRLAMGAREVRVALATGRALVTHQGIVGDVIARGARLLASGASAGVVVDEASLTLLGGAVEVARRPSGAGPEAAHELVLVGDRSGPPRSEVTLLGMPRLYLGRDAELRRLCAAFGDAIDGPAATIAFVDGPPGVGKSRLAEELARTLEGTSSAKILRARPAGFGSLDGSDARGPALSLVRSLLRGALALDLEPERADERLLAAGRSAASIDPVRTAAFLGELAGAPFPEAICPPLVTARRDARTMGDQLTRALAEWLRGECASGPVALFLFDVHLADAASLSLLDAVLPRLAKRPLFLLAVGVGELAPLLPQAPPTSIVLHLEGIEAAAARRIVHDALGDDLPVAVVEELVSTAAGNPFVLGELVRSFDATDAPTTIDAVRALVDRVLEQRLSALPPLARRFMRAASVLGRSFPISAVAAIAGPDVAAEAWSAVARELSAEEILSLEGPSHAAFRHELVRRAAYAMLTEGDRSLAHRLAADWLRAQPHADAAAIAEHERRAGNVEVALHYDLSSAREALAGNDFASVIALYARAEDRGARGELLGRFAWLAAEAHRWKGEHADAERDARRAAKLLPAGSDPWYGALGEIALASGRLGNLDRLARVIVLLRRAPKDVGSDARRRLRIVSAFAAIHLITCGRLELARGLIEDLGRDADADDAAVRARVHQTSAFHALIEGDLVAYLTHMRDAVDAFVEGGDLREACLQGVNVGNAALQLGAYEQAEKVLLTSAADAREMGLGNVAAYADHNLGIVVSHLGRAAEGRAIEARAAAVFEASGDRRMEGVSRVYLAMIDLVVGDTAEAREEARRAVELLDHSPPARACALAVLAVAELGAASEEDVTSADLRAADDRSREAYAIVEALGGIEEGEALVRLMRAEVLLAMGDRDRAREVIERSRERLLARAARVTDPALYKAFLERVPENRRTLELFVRLSAATSKP